jgi:hypothetical protein
MKLFTSIIIALLIAAPSFAQNPLFRNFGDSYSQVISTLNELPYATVTQGEDFITAETPGFRMFFFFHHKALYKMVLTSQFDKRRDAEASLEHFHNFYEHTQAVLEDKEFRNNNVVTHFTAQRNGEDVLVHSMEYGEDAFEIQVIAESATWSPSFSQTISMK